MRYIVLAVLFVIVIGTAGFLALSQKREPKSSVSQSIPSTTPHISQEATQFQQITDEAGLIEFEIPSDWEIMKEGAQGVRLSGIQAESPDFSMRTDDTADGPFTPIYYDEGAHLQISIQNIPLSQGDKPAGEILEEKEVSIDSTPATYFRLREPSTLQGEILDVRFTYDKKGYFFRFGYNPETLPNGENLFFTIISSVVLTK